MRLIIKLNISITITIPDRLGWFFIALTLFYRRLRYGYRFRRIPLTKGKYAIVDPEDFERLNKHKWHASRGNNTFYAARSIRVGKKLTTLKMHREVIHPPDQLFVDHINHNGLDNRKANLRPATHSQNNFNRLISTRGDLSSKYKGVVWNRCKKKWQVRIGIYGKRKYIGHYKDEIQAAKAYDEAAKKFHGEFALLNFNE